MVNNKQMLMKTRDFELRLLQSITRRSRSIQQADCEDDWMSMVMQRLSELLGYKGSSNSG
jgi:hypothetical protein